MTSHDPDATTTDRAMRPRRGHASASANDVHTSTAVEIAELVAAGAMSVVEVVTACLDRAEAVDTVLRPFAEIFRADALDQARRLDAARRDGVSTLPALFGVPIAVKDDTPVAGHPTAIGSVAFRHRVIHDEPVLVQRLRAAGAVILGKTTCSELCTGALTESRLHGVTRNPWNPQRSPGGSSGGSAVAVAAGCTPLATGSDIGGSVRSPASFCGVVGMKPSTGRIPVDFLPTVFEPMMHLGPIAATVDDVSLFMSAVAGPDGGDISSLPALDGPWRHGDADVRGMRLAASVDLGYQHVDDDVRRAFERTCAALESAGATVDDARIEWSGAIEDAWYCVWSVYLAAFFGDDVDAAGTDMGDVVHAQVAAGRAVSAVDLRRVELLRTAMWRDLADVFRWADALVVPANGMTAPACGLSDTDFGGLDEHGARRSISMNLPFNFVPPCPAITVPVGFDGAGMPIGFQIVARPWADLTALTVGRTVERFEWAGTRIPELPFVCDM